MNVKKITLKGFRNYIEQEITFFEGLNVITGRNASGKTNLMESIFVGGVGRSPRAGKDKEMVNWESETANIKIELEKKYRKHLIEVEIQKNGDKIISVNKVGINRLGELVGLLGVIYFSPDELKMIKEAPGERRRFMDISLSQQSKVYYYSLNKYNKILMQRNKLIKTSSYNDFCFNAPVWDIQLAEEGSKLITERAQFLTNLNKMADIVHRKIAGEQEPLLIEYEKCVEAEQTEEIKQQLLAKLSENFSKDYNLGYTSIGVHREDFNIVSNGIELRKYGSQGQQRTAALAIKLAEIEYFESVTGEKPVLLLDDVLSELDYVRRKALLQATIGTQTMLSCTEFEGCEGMDYHTITIQNGKVLK